MPREVFLSASRGPGQREVIHRYSQPLTGDAAEQALFGTPKAEDQSASQIPVVAEAKRFAGWGPRHAPARPGVQSEDTLSRLD